MLDAVGMADALIARDTEDGIVLVDGHLRADMLEGDVPVLIVDLTEEEAGQVLATLDPIAAMAQTNTANLQALINGTPIPVDWEAVMPEAPVLNVKPLSEEEYPVMDKTNITVCPACGHEWNKV